MLGSAKYRAEHGLYPHWMSRGRSRKPLASVSSPPPLMPDNHKFVSFQELYHDEQTRIVRNDGTEMWKGRCEVCADDAEARGSTRRGCSPSGKNVTTTSMGCAACKVYICSKCHAKGLFDSWRHPGDCSGMANMNLRD